jgi:hypothetical protein
MDTPFPPQTVYFQYPSLGYIHTFLTTLQEDESCIDIVFVSGHAVLPFSL